MFLDLLSPSHLAIGLELQCSHLEPNLTIGSISTSQPSSHISPISTDSQQRYQSTLFTFHFSAISIITTTISFGLLVVTTTPFSVSSIASYATTVVTSVPTPFSSISIANFFINHCASIYIAPSVSTIATLISTAAYFVTTVVSTSFITTSRSFGRHASTTCCIAPRGAHTWPFPDEQTEQCTLTISLETLFGSGVSRVRQSFWVAVQYDPGYLSR